MTTTETPGTPATTDAVAYIDRNGEVWISSACRGDNPRGLVLAGEHFSTPLDVIEKKHGPLLPLVREDVAAAREAAACDCYPGGVSPETYEGPQEWCEVHGQTRMVLIQHRDAARDLVDTLRAEVAAVERRLAAVSEIHTCCPCNDACLTCVGCGDGWPCPTARAAAVAD